jgi:hypothetical protein
MVVGGIGVGVEAGGVDGGKNAEDTGIHIQLRLLGGEGEDEEGQGEPAALHGLL